MTLDPFSVDLKLPVTAWPSTSDKSSLLLFFSLHRAVRVEHLFGSDLCDFLVGGILENAIVKQVPITNAIMRV
jgi:hypothetical protein